MKNFSIILSGIALIALSACGSKETDTIESKMEEITERKAEIGALELEIKNLEKEVIALGGSFEVAPDTVAVTIWTVERTAYEEFVDVAGSITSDQNILVGSEMGGTVTRVYVTEGQKVSAGQLLLTTDDQTLMKSIDELQSSYDLAKLVYDKRKTLWDQNIGSEIEYLTAKNNMESLDLRLKTTRSQWAKTQLRAPISGIVDEVITKNGEMASPGMPLLRVVNLSKVKIECDVSEAYLGKIKRGDNVSVSFPSINYETTATIQNVGQVINSGNRTFSVEVSLPNKGGLLKPNLLGYVHIREYTEADQVVIPTKLIQKNVQGDFIYIIENNEVTKKNITRGRSHNGLTQVTAGLDGGEALINEGYRDVQTGDIANVVTSLTSSME